MSYLKGKSIEEGLPDFQANKSVLKLLVEKLREHGEDTALIEDETGRRASYSQVLRYSTSLGVGLQRAGITAGDLVLLCCDNSVLAMSLLMGAMFTGATVVIIPQKDAEVVCQSLDEKRLKGIFYDPAYEELIIKSTRNASPLLTGVVYWDSPQISDWLSSGGKDLLVFSVRDPFQHVPLALTSSGTTGRPKLIPLRDLTLQYIGRSFLLQCDIKSHLLSAPFAWASTTIVLMKAILSKVTLILLNPKSAKDLLENIDKYQIESIMVGPSLLAQCAKESYNTFNLESIKSIVVAAEVVKASQVTAMIDSPLLKGQPRVIVGYGSTECVGMSFCTVSTGYKTGCIGKPIAGVEIKVLDEGNKVVPFGEMGMIAVRSPAVTPGYWADSLGLNQRVFLEDGFFLTGDVGYVGHDGLLYHRGRRADLINYRGSKFSPVEVDDVLLSHPEVEDAVVLGMDHPTDVQHAKGFVVKAPGSTVSQLALEEFVNGQVKEFMKIRAGIQFIEAIPRDRVKIQKRLLREL